MLKNLAIREIMTGQQLKVVHPKDRLSTVKDIFNRYNIHHIPVAVMGQIKGIISQGDLLFLEGMVTNSFDEFLRTKKYQLSTADMIMSDKPVCIESSESISKALDTMINHRINALPVLEGGKLVGIVTSRDMLKHLRRNMQV